MSHTVMHIKILGVLVQTPSAFLLESDYSREIASRELHKCFLRVSRKAETAEERFERSRISALSCYVKGQIPFGNAFGTAKVEFTRGIKLFQIQRKAEDVGGSVIQ